MWKSFAALLLSLTIHAAAQTPGEALPTVAKVEPPNWWAGHSIDPVRLLIRGSDLSGVRVEAPAGLEVGLTRVNARGSYLFVDLHIDPDLEPGAYPLRLIAPSGSTEAPFEILPVLPRPGRFAGFDSDDVIYLLMPDRFANGDPSNDDPAEAPGLLDRSKSRYYHGGDLQGVIDRLAYLDDLGVTAIWMNPIYENVDHLNRIETYDGEAITDYHGYGATDFYDVDEHLGTLQDFRELVDRAHALGIRVIQDQVANHTGPYHPWVEDPPTPTWYNGTKAEHPDNNWQIWTLADPYSPPGVRAPTLDGWFLNILPDLNQGDEETARYLIQNTLWWIGISGMDGIRQDTLPYVPRDFWAEWREAIAREYPDFSVVGEMWDGNAALLSFFQGGQARYDGIDSKIEAVFDFPLFFPIRDAFLGRQPLRKVVETLALDRLYVDPHELVTFVGLHDVARFMSEAGADFQASRLAHALILTVRGIPVIYYGDEIGMQGGNDPDNRRDFPGGWPADPRNAFDFSGRSDQENRLHDSIRQLVRLRRELEPLRRGDTVNLLVQEQQYVFARRTRQQTVVVAFNNDTGPARVQVQARATRLPDGTSLSDRLGGITGARIENGKLTLTLPPRSVAILTAR